MSNEKTISGILEHVLATLDNPANGNEWRYYNDTQCYLYSKNGVERTLMGISQIWSPITTQITVKTYSTPEAKHSLSSDISHTSFIFSKINRMFSKIIQTLKDKKEEEHQKRVQEYYLSQNATFHDNIKKIFPDFGDHILLGKKDE